MLRAECRTACRGRSRAGVSGIGATPGRVPASVATGRLVRRPSTPDSGVGLAGVFQSQGGSLTEVQHVLADIKNRQDRLDALRVPFPADKVKQRPGGGNKMLDYVPIETMLERLLDTAPGYTIENATAQLVDGVGVASLELVIDGKRGFGVGAMKNSDPDMALKSAVSEAIKNAAKNGFGVGLELWNEEYRKTLDTKRALLGGSEAALKREVWRIARDKTGLDKPSITQVAKVFGLVGGELADAAVLREILEGEGLL